MAEYIDENKEISGQIQIADEVIAIIAATAALEVDGVEAASGTPTEAFVNFFGKKNQFKGVRVTVEGEETNIEIDIAIKFGVKIKDTAAAVQRNVKSAVETMTGLKIGTINVNVNGITFERADRKEQPEAE